MLQKYVAVGGVPFGKIACPEHEATNKKERNINLKLK